MKELKWKAAVENGYFSLKYIQGKLCGLQTYMYTCGLVVDIDEIGYERRYCYPSILSASLALDYYEDLDSHAGGAWIKCKGRFKGNPVDLLNMRSETRPVNTPEN